MYIEKSQSYNPVVIIIALNVAAAAMILRSYWLMKEGGFVVSLDWKAGVLFLMGNLLSLLLAVEERPFQVT